MSSAGAGCRSTSAEIAATGTVAAAPSIRIGARMATPSHFDISALSPEPAPADPNTCDAHAKRARNAGPLKLHRLRLPMAMVMAPATMPTVMAVPAMPMMMMPVHLRRRLLGVGLNRCGSAGVAQRQRLSLLGRSREHETCADRRKPKNLRCVHRNPPSMTGCHVCAARLVSDDRPPRRDAGHSGMSDVNVD